MASVSVGQEAPDFTLVNEANEKVTLSELRGSLVVLVFYPFAFSGLCTTEMCSVRDNYDGWIAKGAKVFGISRDSRFVQAAFKKQEHLNYSLLADTKGSAASKYGVWNEAAAAAERATFVVDRDGKVAYVVHNGLSEGRDHSAVEEHIK